MHVYVRFESCDADGDCIETVYGVPLAVKCLVMFRNTQLLDKAPTSTDELLALSSTFEKGVVPLAYPATDSYFHMPWLFG